MRPHFISFILPNDWSVIISISLLLIYYYISLNEKEHGLKVTVLLTCAKLKSLFHFQYFFRTDLTNCSINCFYHRGHVRTHLLKRSLCPQVAYGILYTQLVMQNECMLLVMYGTWSYIVDRPTAWICIHFPCSKIRLWLNN